MARSTPAGPQERIEICQQILIRRGCKIPTQSAIPETLSKRIGFLFCMARLRTCGLPSEFSPYLSAGRTEQCWDRQAEGRRTARIGRGFLKSLRYGKVGDAPVLWGALRNGRISPLSEEGKGDDYFGASCASRLYMLMISGRQSVYIFTSFLIGSWHLAWPPDSRSFSSS